MKCYGNGFRDITKLMPSMVDVCITPGSRETFEAILLDGDSPINLTLETVILTIKDKPGGTTILQKTNVPGAHFDPSNGRTNFTIEEMDLFSLDDGLTHECVFEVRRVNPLSMEFVHIQGNFRVLPEIGRT